MIDETNLPDDAEALVREVARRIRSTAADLRGPRKFSELVEGRRVIARRLRAPPFEWSFPRIARELKKDHSTIINLLRPKRRRAIPAPVPPPPAGAP